MSRLEELNEAVQKLEKRIRLNQLQIEKLSAELELKFGKLDESFERITSDLPKIKEKLSETEDLLNVINLGLIDFKEKIKGFETKFSRLEDLPKRMEKKIVELRNRTKKLEEETRKFHAHLDEMSSFKQELSRELEERVSTEGEKLEREIQSRMEDIEQMKKRLDSISLALKSFEKTIELTNLDNIIKRFDSLDRRILNLRVEVDELRNLVSTRVITQGEVEALEERVKEMSSILMNSLSKMNEFEMNINKKMMAIKNLVNKAENLEFIETVGAKVKQEVAKLQSVKNTVMQLYEEVRKKAIGLDLVRNDLERLKIDMMDLRKVVDENKSKLARFEEEKMEKLMLESAELKKKMRELAKRVEAMKPELAGKTVEEMEKEISSLKEIVQSLSAKSERTKMSAPPEELKTAESRINALRKRIEKLEKELRSISMNRPIILE